MKQLGSLVLSGFTRLPDNVEIVLYVENRARIKISRGMRSGTHLVDVPTTNYKIYFGSFGFEVLQQIYTVPGVVKRTQRGIGAAYSSLAAKLQTQESQEDKIKPMAQCVVTPEADPNRYGIHVKR